MAGSLPAAVMIFQQFVKETEAVNALVEVMAAWGLPLFSMAIIISFIIGFVTGNNIASTATAFILFAPMLTAESALLYLSLIFMIGMVGYLLSPLHLCLLVTNEYYQTNPFKLLAKTSGPIMSLVISTIVLYSFLI
ncbi:MAG: DUF401 family protein [Clostridia bacterium]|nr:DUF401 family protein [Clostridia bacterium]